MAIRTKYNRPLVLVLLFLGGAASGAGCAVRYQRALSSSHSITPGDQANAEINDLRGDFSMNRQEIEILDGSGAFCAMLASAGDRAAARQEALDDAYAGEQVSYQYRVHQASEFQSVHCGGYYSWGVSENLNVRGVHGNATIADTGRPGRMATSEGGFRLGSKSSLASGLNLSYQLDLGYGKWTFDGLDEPRARGSAVGDMNSFGLSRLRRETTYYRAALDVKMLYRPLWAYGLGAYGRGSLDAFAFKRPDYGAGLSFVAPLNKNLIISAELGWGERNRGDKIFYSVQSRELVTSFMLLSRF